jgi:hypothetical protein
MIGGGNSMSTETHTSSNKLPDVYFHIEDEHGVCACGDAEGTALKKMEVQMKIDDNKLIMNLFEYGAMPKIGPADEIAAVRVHVRGKAVSVFAIYNDPHKTAMMGCCSGSGCTCYASGCFC